jgi:peroxiredoxin
MINTGGKAPDFALKDQNNIPVRLVDFKGKKVMLAFFPLAWTEASHDQMKLLDDKYERFMALNTVVLGIGIESMASLRAWSQFMLIKSIRLLSDFWPHGATAKTYGLFHEKDGFSERAFIILDEGHNIILTKTYPLDCVPDIEPIVDFLQKTS